MCFWIMHAIMVMCRKNLFIIFAWYEYWSFKELRDHSTNRLKETSIQIFGLKNYWNDIKQRNIPKDVYQFWTFSWLVCSYNEIHCPKRTEWSVLLFSENIFYNKQSTVQLLAFWNLSIFLFLFKIPFWRLDSVSVNWAQLSRFFICGRSQVSEMSF
jgi:uncharacterized protein (DUF486 family)